MWRRLEMDGAFPKHVSDGLTRQEGQSSHRRKRMVSACIQEIKLVNLASDPIEFSMKIFYRRRVALLEFVGQKSET